MKNLIAAWPLILGSFPICVTQTPQSAITFPSEFQEPSRRSLNTENSIGTVRLVLLLLILCPVIAAKANAQIRDQLHAVCAGMDNSYECAQAIERHQLQKSEYSSTVNRAGSSLRLQLRSGRSLSLRDFQKRGDEASVVKYSFRDYLRDLGYFLIHRQFYEGVDYLMIQDRTGRRYEMQDLPVISPDKRRLVTASNGIGGGYGANAIEVWRLSGRSMIREQTITPEDWGPSDAEWIDNQTIRVVKNLSGDDEARKEHMVLRFRRRWQMAQQ